MVCLWLLVEWMDDNSLFPSYSVVSVNSIIGRDGGLEIGQLIFVREKRMKNVKRAKILKISDSKRKMKEHKILLERNDFEVQNVVSLCMRTIRQLKNKEPSLFNSLDSRSSASSSTSSAQSVHVVAEVDDDESFDDDNDEDDDDSDSEDQESPNVGRARKSVVKYEPTPKLKKRPRVMNIQNVINKDLKRKQPAMVSSTPVEKNINKKSSTDQAVQTDYDYVMIKKDTFAEIQNKIMQMNTWFEALTVRVEDDSSELSDSEYENRQETEGLKQELSNINQMFTEQIANRAMAMKNEMKNPIAKPLRVRRVSAHSTNDIEMCNGNEMFPLGEGNAIVPARLMKIIDWSCPSAATRQLLQAVFPRGVLATHSLTGKPSPAFANKPPKKQLDPKLIEDIVNTVSERCGVSKRIIRSSITIKCTDESKLYRNRQRSRNVNFADQNRENIPPNTDKSSDESSHIDSNRHGFF